MKRNLIIIQVILLLTSVLLAGCGESEKDKAVSFYKGAYPIAKEIRQVADDWNSFLGRFPNVTDKEINSKTQEYTMRLEALTKDLSMLYAPPPLRQLRDNMASAINLGIEAFSLNQQYAISKDLNYARQADQKLMELTRLMMRVADEWDDGLAHYKIKPSEILP